MDERNEPLAIYTPRGNLTRYGLKQSLIEKYERDKTVYKSISTAIFELCLYYGLTLNDARTLFLEIAKERHWHLSPISLTVITSLNIHAGRGEKRILRWYVRQPPGGLNSGAWCTHFITPK